MNKNQKVGGGLKKIGRNKVKCERYLSRDTRTKNKLKKFIKNNIPKDCLDKDKFIVKFNQIQEKRMERRK